MFIHPNHDTDIKPLGKLQLQNNSNRGHYCATQETEVKAVKTAKDHINKRFVETYLN